MALFKVGNKWFVKIMRKGKYFRCGKGFDKKTDAELAQQSLKNQLRAGNPVTLGKTQNFETLFTAYLNFAKENNSHAWYKTKVFVGRKYLQQFMFRNMDDIEIVELESLFSEMRKRVSARSSNLILEVLKNFWSWCFDRDLILKNPFLKKTVLHKFPVDPKPRVLPTANEIELLISKNEGQDRLLVLLLEFTMARSGELKALRWEDVDFNLNKIYLTTHKTKTGTARRRYVPIAQRLRDELLLHRQESGPVLRHHGDKPFSDLRDRLKAIFKRAGVSWKRGAHIFRHLGISRLVDEKVSSAKIMEWAGHADLRIMSLYTHTDENGNDEINKIDVARA